MTCRNANLMMKNANEIMLMKGDDGIQGRARFKSQGGAAGQSILFSKKDAIVKGVFVLQELL